MKSLIAIILFLMSAQPSYAYGKTEVLKINYINGSFVVEDNAIVASKGYSCIVLNLDYKFGYWVVAPKSWKESSCSGFAGKTQSQIYKMHKNDGRSPIIDNDCINLENLRCGYKNSASSSSRPLKHQLR